jgi:LysM repeat protein
MKTKLTILALVTALSLPGLSKEASPSQGARTLSLQKRELFYVVTTGDTYQPITRTVGVDLLTLQLPNQNAKLKAGRILRIPTGTQAETLALYLGDEKTEGQKEDRERAERNKPREENREHAEQERREGAREQHREGERERGEREQHREGEREQHREGEHGERERNGGPDAELRQFLRRLDQRLSEIETRLRRLEGRNRR